MKSNRAIRVAYFPAFLNIDGKKCIVIGGGRVGLRKIRMLLVCGGNVTLISPTLHPALTRLVKKKSLCWVPREYRPEDLKGPVIVIAATGNEEINERIAKAAKKKGILVNVVDDPKSSDFIIPSFFRRKDLTIAVSTSGKTPALAKKIRTVLGQQFGKEYGSLTSLIGEVRSEFREKGIAVSPRAWQQAIELDLLLDHLLSGKKGQAKADLQRKLKASMKGK